jgi:transposase
VPGQTGSGGVTKLQEISRRGKHILERYWLGARSINYRAKELGLSVEQMKQRRPLNVVIVAMANTLARMIWATLADQQPYRKDHVDTRSV